MEEDQRSANEDKRFQSSKSTKDAALDSDTGNSRAPSEDEDIGEWGSSKKDYYNADIIETEADALEEEAEARRLQRKYLQGMTEADFGFDEANWLDNDKDAQWDPKQEVEQHDGVVSQILPQQDITDAMGPDERLQILRTRYPEFEPLAKEFLDLQSLHDDLNLAAKSATVARSTPNSGDNISEGKLPIAAVKHSALSAYLAALAMYFALLTSQRTVSISTTASMSPNELRDHPIMASLVQLRGLWGKVKDIPIPDVMTINTASSVLKKMPKDDEVDTTSGLDAVTTKTKPRKRKSKLERAVARAQEEANTRRLERLQETEASLASLSDLTKVASKPVKVAPRPAEREDDSDFGDPTHLAAHEAAQKEARKKSLKFYTSQIVSKSQKRGAAGRDAGGDADLPYKERLRDRQERLNAQAEKRGKKNKPSEEEALGGESDEEDARAAREIRDGGEEDYYDLIANKTSTKKVEKARLAAEQAAAVGGLVRIPDDEMDGEDGKRAISYAIEKNKGLHPKRKKEVRNPRYVQLGLFLFLMFHAHRIFVVLEGCLAP